VVDYVVVNGVVSEYSIDVDLIKPLPRDIQFMRTDVHHDEVFRSSSRNWVKKKCNSNGTLEALQIIGIPASNVVYPLTGVKIRIPLAPHIASEDLLH